MKRRGLIGLAVASAAAPLAAGAQGGSLVIFAAASLKNALDEIAAAWTKVSSKPVPRISYAASPALARQIEQGAPADLFISADTDWMDYAAQRNLIRADTRVNLLGNSIVLIAPRDSATAVEVKPGVDLAKPLGSGRLAMANVDAVPAGKYGKAALEKLGAWQGVKDRLAQAENVRAALLLVSRGEARMGIVYRTDAASDRAVRVLDAFPGHTHPPIVYPVAVTAGSTHVDAEPFVAFLRSAAARPIFEKQGFSVLN